MDESLQIEFDPLHGERGTDVERATLADIRIHFAGRSATEIVDLRARCTRGSVRASAYHLAHWLTANWWRLRWEPEGQGTDWRLSHELGAVGGGYVWPALTLISDGATVLARSRPTEQVPSAPIRYLSHFDLRIPGEAFEHAVDAFVENVLERLEQQGLRDHELGELWGELSKERGDAASAEARKLEALLGYDPDEAPQAWLQSLRREAEEYGTAAVEEMAAAAKARVARALSLVRNELQPHAKTSTVPDTQALRQCLAKDTEAGQLPWQRAARLAAIVRDTWKLEPGPISNRILEELFDLGRDALETSTARGPHEPIGAAAFRNGDPSRIDLCLPRRHSTGRRFALARLVGDHIHAGTHDRLLPATRSKTARQKFQRAFAQELLCPFDALRWFLGTEDPDEDAIDEAAEHFEVSPLLVKTALVNRGVLPRDALPE